MAKNSEIALQIALAFCVISAIVSHVLGQYNDIVGFFTGCSSAFIVTGLLRPVSRIASEDGEMILQLFNLKRNKLRVIINAMFRAALLTCLCAGIGKIFGQPGIDEKVSAMMLGLIVMTEYLSTFQATPAKNLTISVTEKTA